MTLFGYCPESNVSEMRSVAKKDLGFAEKKFIIERISPQCQLFRFMKKVNFRCEQNVT